MIPHRPPPPKARAARRYAPLPIEAASRVAGETGWADVIADVVASSQAEAGDARADGDPGPSASPDAAWAMPSAGSMHASNVELLRVDLESRAHPAPPTPVRGGRAGREAAARSWMGIVEVETMSREGRLVVLRSVHADLDRAALDHFDLDLGGAVLDHLLSAHPRRARRALDDAMMRAAAEGRRALVPVDVGAPDRAAGSRPRM